MGLRAAGTDPACKQAGDRWVVGLFHALTLTAELCSTIRRAVCIDRFLCAAFVLSAQKAALCSHGARISAPAVEIPRSCSAATPQGATLPVVWPAVGACAKNIGRCGSTACEDLAWKSSPPPRVLCEAPRGWCFSEEMRLVGVKPRSGLCMSCVTATALPYAACCLLVPRTDAQAGGHGALMGRHPRHDGRRVWKCMRAHARWHMCRDRGREPCTRKT